MAGRGAGQEWNYRLSFALDFSARPSSFMETINVIDFIKEHTPWGIRRISRRIKHHFHGSENGRRSARDVFTEIYVENRWGGGRAKADSEFPFDSGVGSGPATAEPYAECVNRFI